jgi:putative transposase
MIERDHDLPVKRQAQLLSISRGSVYYLPRSVSPGDLALMRRIDELHLDYPFAGARMLRDLLAGEGIRVGRLHVSTLMKRMGIEAIYRKPNTSKPAPGHKVYPYLLRKLPVTRPNQVWAMDITYTTRWPEASSISAPSSTGSAAGCCPSGSRSAWMPAFASRRSMRPIWRARNLQHRPGEPVHQHRLHHDAARQRHRHQHGRQGIVAR